MSGPALRSLIAVLVVLTTAAFGYEDTGFDPDDTQNCHVPDDPEGCDKTPIYNPDISSTTRKVRQNADGHRFLSVTIRSYEPVMDGCCWIGMVALDSRGGPRRDYRMIFDSWERSRCGVASYGTSSRRGNLRSSHDSATCVVPLRFVHPTKRIRWRVSTDYFFPKPYETQDLAPNGGGWYV